MTGSAGHGGAASGVRCAVIVPTRERPEQLRRCLSALEAQEYPPELLEVIVWEDHERAGPAAARNEGAARAGDAELLLWTDDDAVPSPTWVAEMAAAHRRAPGAMLGGRIQPDDPGNAYARAYESI